LSMIWAPLRRPEEVPGGRFRMMSPGVTTR
jgi:hypothetical protein